MKQRIITGIIMVLICIPFVYFGNDLYNVGIAAISLLGLKEIWDMKSNYPLYVKVLSMFSLLFIMFTNIYYHEVNIFLYSIIVALTLLIMPSIFSKKEYKTKDAFYLSGLVIFLGITANGLMIIRQNSVLILLYLILISTCNEVFALLCGKLFGKHKLIPSVSPNKTIEGSVGGLIIGSIVPIIFFKLFIGDITIKLIVVTILLSIIGQFGDLVFSKIKRENKIKDFSNLMPGHGGILDRIDSISWIVITYMILMCL